MKRFLSLLLSLLLAFNGCIPVKTVARSYLRADQGRSARHGATAFRDMVLAYPDPEEVISALDKALDGIDSTEGPQACIAVYEAQLEAYDRLVSAASLAYVRYCQDVTDEQRAEEYGKLNSSLYPIQHRLASLEKALMERYGYHEDRGAAYAEALDRIRRQDELTIGSLRDREDELCRRYERLDAEFRVTYRGREWSMDDLLSDESLTLQEFLEALEQYQAGKNEAAGKLFLELMSLRNQVAADGGYASYAANQYAAYGREYTPDQAFQAAQVVKQVFVPLYVRMREQCENDLRYLSGAAFREDEFIATMAQAVDRAMPGAGEAWQYMLAYDLYDSRPSERKMQGSFTTYLAAYRCPFLFTQWKDDASSVFTVIHEFGHFLSYYMNPEGTYYGSENLDLAETDAQGFELLMLDEYDAIFGRYASAARLCFLTNAIYAILSGFMEDEFQQRAYQLKNPSVGALNRLYGEVAASYGFDKLFGYDGTEWTEIGHTFQFPFYYVSYGVSMLGAMSLLRGGSRAYRRLIKRGPDTAFTEVVGKHVLNEETIRALAALAETSADAWLQN